MSDTDAQTKNSTPKKPLRIQYADAHCHLQDSRLAPCLDALLRRARESGVAFIHSDGTREADWPATATLADRPMPDGLQLRLSFGIHPWHATEASPGWPERLRGILLVHPRAGIGEIGLDGSLPGGLSSAQWDVFRRQWDLSLELRRPVSLHGRGAWPAILGFLLSQPPHPAGVLLHAYGGSPDALATLAERNVFISLGGALANPSNRRARRVASAAVPGHFLLETDAPDMPPPGCPFSEPSRIPSTAALWADILSLSLSDFATATTAAFRKLFP